MDQAKNIKSSQTHPEELDEDDEVEPESSMEKTKKNRM